jgi:hypothetical protein
VLASYALYEGYISLPMLACTGNYYTSGMGGMLIGFLTIGIGIGVASNIKANKNR